MLCSSPGLRLRANASSLRSARNVRIAKRQVGCASKVDDWNTTAQTLETASPLMIMDHALSTFGDDVAIAFSCVLIRGTLPTALLPSCPSLSLARLLVPRIDDQQWR